MKFVLIAMVLFYAGCTQPDKAHRVLSGAGYTDIRLDGYDFFACAKDEAYHDKFTAKGPNGQSVSGVVCSGLLFKSSTIRFN